MTKVEQIIPLGKLFAILTKQYLGALSEKLEHLPIDRYFYSFWVISENNGNINSKELSEIVRTDKVLIVRIIKYLTAKKLIERKKHPEDKRSFLLHITPEGHKYVPDVNKALLATDKEFTEAIDTKNTNQFLNGITKLVNNLGSKKGEQIILDYTRLKNEK